MRVVVIGAPGQGATSLVHVLGRAAPDRLPGASFADVSGSPVVNHPRLVESGVADVVLVVCEAGHEYGPAELDALARVREQGIALAGPPVCRSCWSSCATGSGPGLTGSCATWCSARCGPSPISWASSGTVSWMRCAAPGSRRGTGSSGAIAQLDRCQQLSANWQLALGDGVTKLISQVDFDLRERLREVMEGAEQDITQADPRRDWKRFDQAVRGKVDEGVRVNFHLTTDRSRRLAQDVATKLAGNQDGSPSVWSVTAGGLLGLFTFWEDRKNGKERGKVEAKIAVSKLMDSVNFRVSEGLRAQLRAVHRTLRDHFTEINDQRLRAASDAVRAAVDAAQLPGPQRDARLSQLRNHLAELRQLRIRATVPAR